MKINMSLTAVSALVMNAMFLACIISMTGAFKITLGKCEFQRAEDLCFLENPQEQIWVEKGGYTSMNWALAFPEAIGQGLNATWQEISLMSHNSFITNGTDVTDFLSNNENWKVDFDFKHGFTKINNDPFVIFNQTVSLNHATYSDDIELHLEIRFDNLIFKTGYTHINIPGANRENPTSRPATSTVSETSNNSQCDTSTATDLQTTTATTNVPYSYQSGPSNSAIFWTMICGFLILAVLIVREWIISQVMRILTYCQQNIPCIDQPSPSGNDPPTDLSPPGTGTSAQTCENVGTPTDSTEEQTRNGGNELLVLRPEHEDSEPMEHRSSMSAKQHQLRKSQAYQAGTTVPEYHEKDTLMGNT